MPFFNPKSTRAEVGNSFWSDWKQFWHILGRQVSLLIRLRVKCIFHYFILLNINLESLEHVCGPYLDDLGHTRPAPQARRCPGLIYSEKKPRVYQINFLRICEQCDIDDVTTFVDGPRTRRGGRNVNRDKNVCRFLKVNSFDVISNIKN